MKFKHLPTIISLFLSTSFLIALGAVSYSSYYFANAHHNIDLVFNMAKDDHKLFTSTDIGADGVERPLLDYYRNGMNQSLHNFWTFGIACFAIGIILTIYLQNVAKNKR